MKRLFIFALAAMAGVAFSEGRTLTPAEAYARMLQQSSVPAKVRSMSKLDVDAPAKTINMADGKAAVYMFVGPDSSYVLVGADDLALPMLGYGSVGHGEEMPPQMVAWLDGYARRIAWADSVSSLTGGNTNLVGAKIAERKAPLRAPAAAIAPMVTTRWNQDSPYNLLCPMDGSQRSVTGCMATALAQVMKYHQWPERGAGTGTATVKGENPTSKSLAITFDWGNMLDDYSGSSTTKQKNAVAQLMMACGYAVSMDYSASASGANDHGAYDAVINHFNYDKTSWFYSRDYYSLDDWQEMLLNQLTSDGPILYTGASSEGGHAFVCDGYDGNGKFHFNWGWGGYYDGYFAIDALNPEGQGIGGYEGGYNSYQTAMLGVRKPVAGSVRPQVQLGTYKSTADLQASISGKQLTLEMPFYNVCDNGVTFSGAIGVEFADVSTGQASVSTIYSDVELDYGYGTDAAMQIELPSKADGTYQIRYVTKETGYTSWVPMLNEYPYKNYCYVKYSGGSASIVSNPQPSGEFTIESATGPEYVVKGESSSYTIKIKNTYAQSMSATLAPAIVEVASDGNYIVANDSPVTFTVAANSTLDKTVEFNLTYKDYFNPEANNVLVLYDPEAMSVVHNFGAIEVREPATGEFTIESATGPEYVVKGESSSYTIRIKNTYAQSMSATLAPAIVEVASDGNYIVANDSPVTFTVAANSTLDKTVEFNLTYKDYFNPEANNVLVLYDPEAMSIVHNFGAIEVREPATGEFTVESATGPESIVKGESASYTVTLNNTYNQPMSAIMAAGIVDKRTGGYYLVASAEATTFTVNAKSSLTQTVDFTLSYSDEFDAAAENYLILYNPEAMSIYYNIGRIEVTDPVPVLPSLTALGQLPEFETGTDVTVDLDLTVVYANGSYNYVYDGTSYGLIYKNGLNLEPGRIVAKGWEATVTVYDGLIEIVPKESSLALDGTGDVPAGERIFPDEIDAWLTPANQNMLVAIDHVIFSSPTPAATVTSTADRKFTGTVGGRSVNFFQRFGVESVPAGEYEVIGFISVFNDTVQIYPVSFNSLSGIMDVDATEAGGSGLYDLRGVRVTRPTPGLYIRNGRKILIRH